MIGLDAGLEGVAIGESKAFFGAIGCALSWESLQPFIPATSAKIISKIENAWPIRIYL